MKVLYKEKENGESLKLSHGNLDSKLGNKRDNQELLLQDLSLNTILKHHIKRFR